MKLLKLIWAWVDWKELKRQIAAEYKDAVKVSILLFIVILMLMIGMANHDYNRIFERQNYLESRMNSFDRNIPNMTEVK